MNASRRADVPIPEVNIAACIEVRMFGMTTSHTLEHRLRCSVFSEIEKRPKDIRAKFAHIVRLIQANGLEHVHDPYIKHLEGKLWEMRLEVRDAIARAIDVTAVEKRVIVVRVFTKKTQKIPRHKIETASERANEAL